MDSSLYGTCLRQLKFIICWWWYCQPQRIGGRPWPRCLPRRRAVCKEVHQQGRSCTCLVHFSLHSCNGKDLSMRLTMAYITSRLVYCNSVLKDLLKGMRSNRHIHLVRVSTASLWPTLSWPCHAISVCWVKILYRNCIINWPFVHLVACCSVKFHVNAVADFCMGCCLLCDTDTHMLFNNLWQLLPLSAKNTNCQLFWSIHSTFLR